MKPLRFIGFVLLATCFLLTVKTLQKPVFATGSTLNSSVDQMKQVIKQGGPQALTDLSEANTSQRANQLVGGSRLHELPAMHAPGGDAYSVVQYVELQKKRPLEGGYWRALQATLYCKELIRIKGQLRLSDSINERGNTAEIKNRVQEMCSNIKIDGTSLEYLVREGESLGDPFVSLERSSLSTAESYRSRIEKIVNSRDPYLIATQGSAILASRPTDLLARRVYLDGAWLSPSDTENAKIAAALIKCDFGMYCGKDSPEIILACASGGPCDLGLADLVGKLTKTSRGLDYEKVMSYRRKISSAIRDKELYFFIPPGS